MPDSTRYVPPVWITVTILDEAKQWELGPANPQWDGTANFPMKEQRIMPVAYEPHPMDPIFPAQYAHHFPKSRVHPLGDMGRWITCMETVQELDALMRAAEDEAMKRFS